MYRHRKSCKEKNKDDTTVSRSEYEYLLEKVRQLENKPTQNNIQNITANNVINNNNVINVIAPNQVPLREFGQENKNAIPYSCIIGCILDDLNYRGLLENLHFDPDYPEDRNVRMKSVKRSMMEIYKNNRWNVTTLQNGLKELIEQGTRIFNEFLKDNKHRILDDDLTPEELEELLVQLSDIDQMRQKYVEPMKKDIQGLLESYKKTSMVLSNG